jgi:ABC-2 type transport system ATP-binding protein
MDNLILIIKSLAKTYKKDVIALTDLNISLKKGVTLGLLGPNGAGKSTIVNILANIVKRDSGDIYIYDEKITEISYQYKSTCGFVLEKPVYIGKLSIVEYLEFSGKMYRLSYDKIHSRIKELIDIFNLVPKKDTWIENCSKGMKKKISIATSLLHNPQLLILDEPFSDLDLVALGRLKEIIHNLKKNGKTVLMASHNIQELENVCDEFAMIQEGKILFQKSFKDIQNEIKEKKLGNFENYVYQHIDKNHFEKSLSWLE